MNTVSVWKRSLAIFLAALMIVGMIPLSEMLASDTYAATPSKLYLKPNSNWTKDGARFAAYFFGNGTTWVSMTDSDGDGVYEVTVPSGYPNVIFCRMNPKYSTNSWDANGIDYMWNQTGDLTIPTDGKNCFTVPAGAWDGSTTTWSTYTPAGSTTEVTYYVVGTEVFCGVNWEISEANKMTKTANGTYTITYTNVKAASEGTYQIKVKDSDGKWYSGGSDDSNYWINVNTLSDVTITFNPSTGAINYTVTPISGSGSADGYFYVDTDLVDYLNDNRVNSGSANGYNNDNQGVFDGNDGQNSMYGYINHVISSQNYTYPLYFGPLATSYLRYGWAGSKTTLNNYYSAANAAVRYYNKLGDQSYGDIFDASVQGLVGKTLVNGNLTDPNDSTKELFYFDRDAAAGSQNQWVAAGKTNPIMAYYADLKFPFNMKYDETTRVTTYSYDSATDYAVFYDYTNPELQISSTGIANYTAGTGNGFYPLNKVGDSGDAINNGFGMKLTIQFTVSNDGKVKVVNSNGTTTETDVIFKFTGDDDVWVFIDDQLVLDMGGAHSKSSGEINFADLNATVKKAYNITDETQSWSEGDDERAEFLYSTFGADGNGVVTAFPENLAAQFNNEYTTGVSQVHTLTMFYMERGMFDSNMSIEFNMSPIPSGLTVSKDIANVNPGLNNAVQGADEFSFDITATNDGENVTFDGYILTDHNSVSENMTATNNRIEGVRGDRYARAFTTAGLDAFLAGTVFTVTELSGNTVFTYTGTTWKLFDADKGYDEITTGLTGKGTASAGFSIPASKEGNYALNFINTLATGSLTITKNINDSVLSDKKFVFTVELDLDGNGAVYTSQTYAGLTYTINGTTYTSADGTIVLTGSQTAVISGIPAGATYKVTEQDPTDADIWTKGTSSGTTGTITSGGNKTATFKNNVKSITENKIIYVEAGKPTDYAVKYNGEDVTLSSITPVTGLTATKNGSVVTVTGAQANQAYTMGYVGRLTNGEAVSGTITVYSYKAMDKTYVFDFGLSSVISNTTTGGHGLFQGGTFIIVDDNATSTLTITGGGTQTTITASGSFDESDPSKVPTVTFTPVAFMSQVEEYTYTVTITANGKTFKANDPETGCTVTGTIKVMPANTVYYEDNFNVKDADNKPTQEIIFNQGNSSVALTAPSSNPTLAQSNDQSTNYGKDDCYKNSSSYDAYGESNGASTTLAHLQYAYFTFSGTGFDLISETKADSAGMAVYVFAGGFDQAHLDYVTNHSNTSQTPADLVFVNNYYANGSLYQVPVASVRLSTQSTYTVYVQALSTMHGDSVTIDGVRIYNPLTNTDGYKSNEKGVQIDELRVLYKNEYVGLAGKGTNNSLFVGLGRQSVVQGAMANASILEDPNGKVICTAADLENIYLHGPNNELYLPYNFGINLSYTVNSADWTLQIGAKAVTEKNEAKSFTVYVKNANGTYTDANSFVVDVTSTTDMYYDLTEKLTEKGFGNEGSYEIIILSNSAYENNEFVSLTTVKHKGIEIKK